MNAEKRLDGSIEMVRDFLNDASDILAVDNRKSLEKFHGKRMDVPKYLRERAKMLNTWAERIEDEEAKLK